VFGNNDPNKLKKEMKGKRKPQVSLMQVCAQSIFEIFENFKN